MAGRYQAIIFDMDGTLIEPLLDFAAIRRELNIPAGRGLLEGIAEMPPLLQGQAHQILLKHELHAARTAELMPGVHEALTAVAGGGYKTALMTRNTRQAADIVRQRFPELTFDVIRCREDGVIKPEPDGIYIVCRQLEVQPACCLCVGDFHYDIMAANAAGCVSVLLAPRTLPDWADEADLVIRSLHELPALLEQHA